MGYTLAEKIIMRNTGKEHVSPGDIVVVKPDMTMVIDTYTPFVYEKFYEMGFKKVWNPDKIVYIHDHFIPTSNVLHARLQRYGEMFVEEQGIKHFHRSEGICHQLMPQLRYAKPGEITFATDSHTTTYGAVCNFSTGIGYTEMAAVFGTGELWLRVPSTIKIRIDGTLPTGVYAKDVILRILGDIKADGGTYKSLEFCGEVVDDMSIDSRLTIANMVVECGGKVGLFPCDEKTAEYSGIDLKDYAWLKSDEDAVYERVIHYNADEFEPYIACPCYVDNVKPISQVEGTKVNQVFLGSCTNGRLEDLAVAAKLLKGRKVDKYTKLIITPASRSIFEEAIKLGYISTLVKAGAIVLQTGCTLCCGTNYGIVSDNQVILGTNNRNFLGRMGSAKSEIYLCSPAVAAISSVYGKITDPRKFAKELR